MPHNAPLEIVGTTCILRATSAKDSDKVFEAICESQELIYPSMRWATAIPDLKNTLNSCTNAADQWRSGDSLSFTIWSLTQDRVLGRCSLHHIDWGVPKFEVGYWVRKSEQGKGIATEATRLITNMAFEVLSAKRVSIWCSTENVSSQRVAEKLGFHLEGTLKNDEVDALGRPVDMLVFGLTRP